MKTKFMRSLLAVLGIGALLVALVAYNPSTTTAANLTGGQYTYLIDGEEVTFTFDPISRKDGLLLPIEVFQKFNINIEGALTRTITLSRDGVSAKITVGATAFELNGLPRSLTTAPLRLNGRVFLPADLLKEFGVDFSQDGNYVSLRNFTDRTFRVDQLTDSEWNSLKGFRGFTSMLKADSGVNMYGEYYLLNEQMVTAANLNITYGNRARLLGLLESNTLVLVKVSNLSNKAGGVVTAGMALIDNQRNQYDVQSVVDIGYGLLTSKLAPAGDRYGVLAFPKLPANVVNAILYYDNNGSSLGTFVKF
ncbi:MAG TPA: copper amine oxidase N-terminal domain-containing protein [Symbiobacteriaceae bacterium]|nr:copper amine oxidase N-terminal domain-containing protein [Symbiobacteriaceae bacterium]